MARTKVKTDDGVVKSTEYTEPVFRWRKLGRGSFRMPNRIIKPGEIFEAPASAIPKAFRDVIVPVDDIPEEVLSPKVTGRVPVYKPVKREDSNWWDVVDENGKVISEKALTKKQAEELVTSLSS